MKNNAICNLVGSIGCIISFFCFVCYFFGMAFGLWGTLVGMALYDGVLLMGASVLFDYLWYED